MKILKPKYYDDFNCIASECPYTCCSGWSVNVDKKSFLKYRKIPGLIGKEVNKKINRKRVDSAEDAYGQIVLDEHGRCSFLNEQNLCDMYLKLGEQAMCVTCKTYPRLIIQLGNIYERSMTLSCPEVARLIFENKEPIEFVLVEETLSELDYGYLNQSKKDIKQEELLRLSDMRTLFIVIAQNRALPIWKRLLLIRKYAELVDKKVDNHTYHDKFIEVLYKSIEEESILKSLEQLEINEETKHITINAVMNYLKSLLINVPYEGLSSLIEDTQNFREALLAEEIDKKVMHREFENFMKDKDYVFEHYMVYYLYTRFIINMNLEKGITTEVNLMFVFYSLIRNLIEAQWYQKKESFTIQDIIKTFYSFSRHTEHSSKIENDIREIEIMEQFKDINCCSILIR